MDLRSFSSCGISLLTIDSCMKSVYNKTKESLWLQKDFMHNLQFILRFSLHF